MLKNVMRTNREISSDYQQTTDDYVFFFFYHLFITPIKGIVVQKLQGPPDFQISKALPCFAS